MVLAVLFFTVFRITVLGVIFTAAAAVLLALLFWITWIRRQYAFGGGGMMEGVHHTVLSHLDYDGKGKLLDVGCGSGALSIRAALTWPETKVTAVTKTTNYSIHIVSFTLMPYELSSPLTLAESMWYGYLLS